MGCETGAHAGRENQLVIRRTRVAHDPRFPRGVGERDPLPLGQWMTFRDDQVQRVVQQWPLIEAVVGHGRRVRGDDHQREVGLLGEQQVEAAVGFGFDDAHGEMGVGVAQPGRRGWQQTAGGGGEAAQRDLAGGFGTGGGQLGAGQLPLFLQAFGVAQQDAGRVRQADAPALVDDQVHADLGGEADVVGGDGGGGVVQRLCGGGHGAVLGDHLEDAEPGVNHAKSLHDQLHNRLIPLVFLRPHTGERD